MQIGYRVTDLFSGLYADSAVEDLAGLAQHYLDTKDYEMHRGDGIEPVPGSLRGITGHRSMSNGVIPKGDFRPRGELFRMLGVEGEETINGPLNHILARMITIPRMIDGYNANYPTDPGERAIYTDPPMLQLEQRELMKIRYDHFAMAAEILRNPAELVRRFHLLGDIGEDVARVESAYPARGSTQAYENFGIFHLFPSNRQVDITATSPGVILPTEADPLRFKDSVVSLKKNLLRPTYFEMLRHSIDLGPDRIRRYSAGSEGTAKDLRQYPQLLEAAKKILSDYLELGEAFEIRLGEQAPAMKLATLIGDTGVVYSVRDPEQKNKIAHNVTVFDPEEAALHRKFFEEQWARGDPIRETSVLDKLMQG